jgi:prephenate dehydrogenase
VTAVDIAVIGLGLIGGSLAQALARAGHDVLAFDTDPGTRATARTAATQDRGAGRWDVVASLPAALAYRDLVVLAVPPPAVPAVLAEVGAAGFAGIVTDVTSVKTPVQAAAEAYLGRATFVGGHPMAGRETGGFASARPDLFAGCAWALCLPGPAALPAWLDVADVLTRLGARVVPTTAAEHDRAVATVSHVPHLLAAALVDAAAGEPLALTLAAGSFRDGTRVAATPAALSAAMCAGNAAAVRQALRMVVDSLEEADRILAGDPVPGVPPAAATGQPGGWRDAGPMAALRSWFEPAGEVRRAWPAEPSEVASLPAVPEVLLRLGRVGGWVTGVSHDRSGVTGRRPTPMR